MVVFVDYDHDLGNHVPKGPDAFQPYIEPGKPAFSKLSVGFEPEKSAEAPSEAPTSEQHSVRDAFSVALGCYPYDC